MNDFSKFTTDQLLAEISRRRNARIARRPILNCDQCQRFIPCQEDVMADTYNPCEKGHKMSFRHPETDDGPTEANDDWGFYRTGCADRMFK